MKKVLLILFATLLLSACASPQKRPERPAWIDNPGNGVSASCTTHVRGRHFQEELAISRAREQLAARYGVTVKMTQNIKEVLVNDSASVTSVKNSEQTIDNGKMVIARVKAKWLNKITDELWVWLVPE